MAAMFKEIVQVGFVVKNVQETAERFSIDFGLGPWTFYLNGPQNVKDQTVNGERCDHSWKTAVGHIGSIEIELIEPLDDRSIYAEHLKNKGEGIHHLQLRVDDYDKSRSDIGAKRCPEMGSGIMDGIRFSYFDTETPLKFITEIVSLRHS
jgi:methylmalonyl-CoA/ethylmalonyl-CoA epimerase